MIPSPCARSSRAQWQGTISVDGHSGPSSVVSVLLNDGPSIPLSSIVIGALRCGAPGYANNLVDLLQSRGLLRAITSLANNVSATLNTQLTLLSTEILPAIDTAMATLKTAYATGSTSIQVPYDTASLGSLVALLTNFSTLVLPSVQAPPTSRPSDLAEWRDRFGSMYGSSRVTGPTAPVQQANANIFTAIKNVTDSVESITAIINGTMVLANQTPVRG